MRVPQVKEAPPKALRAMFAGIGQLLSITDKLRGKPAASPDPETVVPATAPQAAAPQTPAPEAAAPEAAAPETVVLETVVLEAEPATADSETPTTPGGHVRLIQPDPVPAAPADPVPAPAPAAVVAPVPAAVADPAPSAELPLANYDELTIASLRARLRNLSGDQLGQLIDYEKGHADRADVITMFERRITKLAEG